MKEKYSKPQIINKSKMKLVFAGCDFDSPHQPCSLGGPCSIYPVCHTNVVVSNCLSANPCDPGGYLT
ncbi:MAG: hypothetical protein JXA60_02235 [Candidatus Coatesbacteria bacterium]|nr:hypothetical protein [Candidatus Coatesbacteria bacterium]